MSKVIEQSGTLFAHNDWITQVAINPRNPELMVSSSRDKTLVIWKLLHDENGTLGYTLKRLHGHSHFISDFVISSDGNYALSSSWDKTLRLWDLNKAKCTRRFLGHTNDVLSVAFSPDNRQIVSGSRDKTMKLWNTLAQCKYTIIEDGHTDWVSCVRFAPNQSPLIISCGWDHVVKVWNLVNCKLVSNHYGHTGYLNNVAVSPDGSLCSSGGKDEKALLWDLNDARNLHCLEHNDIINTMCFSPNRYWLCVAYGSTIKIWDLANRRLIAELCPEVGNKKLPQCLCLTWSLDGRILYAGYTDKVIRVWKISSLH